MTANEAISPSTPSLAIRITESLVVAFAGLLTISVYLASTKTESSVWSWFLGSLMVSALIVSIGLTYKQMTAARTQKNETSFRLDLQFIETLKALNSPADLTYALEKLLGKYPIPVGVMVQGETAILRLLAVNLGRERTREVSQTVLKYASLSSESADSYVLTKQMIEHLKNSSPELSEKLWKATHRHDITIALVADNEKDFLRLVEFLAQAELTPDLHAQVLKAEAESAGS